MTSTSQNVLITTDWQMFTDIITQGSKKLYKNFVLKYSTCPYE